VDPFVPFGTIMGQEIVYCFKCQNRLLGSDFERGKAFRINSQVACSDCARSLLAHLPDPDAELERLKRTQVPRSSGVSSSSTKLPAIRAGQLESTARMQVPPARAETPKSKLPLYLAVGGGALLLLVLLVVMSSGTKETPSHSGPVAPPPEIVVPTPPPPKPGPAELLARELEELDARTLPLLRKDQVQEAARIFVAARGKHAAPEWQRGIDERLQKLDAVARRVAAPLLEQVEMLVKKGDSAALKDLRSRVETLGFPVVVADFDKAVNAAAADPWIFLELRNPVSEGGAVLTLREDRSVLVSGPNPPQDAFTVEAQVGLKQVRAFRLEALPDPSLPAEGPGRTLNGNVVLSEFKVLAGGRPLAFSGASSDFEQDKYPSSAALDGNPLTGWALAGHLGQASAAVFHLQAPVDLSSVTLILEHRSIHAQHVLGRFRISVAVLELPPPPPPRFAEASQIVSKTPLQIPPAVLAYQKTWASAGPQAASRDLAAAVKAVEEARAAMTDEALRKEADGDLADLKLAADALAEVPRLLPRWSKGTKLKLQFIAEAGTAELVEGVVLESSAKGVTLQAEGGILEVPSGELAAESIAALLALRGEKRPGDARAAAVLGALEGRPSAELPKKFAGLKSAADSKESEARRIFWAAEEDYAGMRTRGKAGGAYATLLEKNAQTAFVVRNKPFLEDRLAGTRDFFYFADDLAGTGTFSATGSSKVESYWMSNADSPAKAASNYLEVELLIQPNATYRAWVYAGGCCQEVFTFFLQGSGLSGPSARNPKESVTAEPGGEEWIAVKPPSLSLKKKHFDHTGPKEPDRWAWVELGPLKFAEPGMKKLRILTEQKGFAVAYLAVSAIRQAQPREVEVKDLLKNRPPADYGPTGTILREIWKGIGGDAVSDLLNNPKFKEGKPDLSGPISAIDSWSMGDQYGCRIRGYVHPPVSGEYVFWIASDDHGELWLSQDDTPAKKQKICSLNHAVGHRDWNADPSQKSNAVSLTAGKRYYIEVLQKQGGGGEHVAVGWQLPGGAQERPIPPQRLSPFGVLPSRKVARPQFRAAPPLSPEGPVAKSEFVGGQGGTYFEQAPTPRLFLRGLKYALTGSGCLGALQPLYTGPSGDSEGNRVGQGALAQEIAARPGYAVGGMIARGTDRLNAFKLIFMRVSGSRLLSSDRYESDWVGTRGGGAEMTLGGDGTPVLGLFGKAGGEIDGAGLLLLGK
jgi:hypothetical protein